MESTCLTNATRLLFVDFRRSYVDVDSKPAVSWLRRVPREFLFYQLRSPRLARGVPTASSCWQQRDYWCRAVRMLIGLKRFPRWVVPSPNVTWERDSMATIDS